MKDNSQNSTVTPEKRIDELIDQSLVGLMFLVLLAVSVLLFRLYQYGITTLHAIQFVACCLLFAMLYFRRKLPQPMVFGTVILVFVLVAALALVRFALVTPALVIITVFPIIIASVSGKKPALLFAFLMLVVIVSIGSLYVLEIVQPSANLQGYMQQPINWGLYAAAYAGMVFWGSVLAAKLTDFWQESLRDVKNAEDATLREREVVATLQRQQSIVQLSGGVAHDFNNILAAITTNIEIATDNQKDPANAELVKRALSDAMDATDRGTELTRSLLSFAKVAVLEPKELDINRVVERSIGWISRTIQENIEIETSLAEDLQPIIADEGSLSSALLNLILNARDAMPDGGNILIKTQNLHIADSEETPAVNALFPGHYVELTVTDTGTGIVQSEQEQIFEPFYSTKGPSGGSGLGLAMVQGFMRQSGGTVDLTSTLGSGSTFRLLFRTIGEQRAVVEPDTPRERKAESSDAYLMIVEDEKLLLDSLKTILKSSGYKVLTASNGDQAWEILNQGAKVDLVLSDVVMPGKLQGTDLALKIQDANLDLPVVLMSGYTFSMDNDQDVQSVSQLLHKPIRKVDLIDAIEAALQGLPSRIQLRSLLK